MAVGKISTARRIARSLGDSWAFCCLTPSWNYSAFLTAIQFFWATAESKFVNRESLSHYFGSCEIIVYFVAIFLIFNVDNFVMCFTGPGLSFATGFFVRWIDYQCSSIRIIAKFHYTDTNPTRTGHGQSPRTLSGPCRVRVVEFSFKLAQTQLWYAHCACICSGATNGRRCRGGAKQPHQKYFMTNDHESE